MTSYFLITTKKKKKLNKILGSILSCQTSRVSLMKRKTTMEMRKMLRKLLVSLPQYLLIVIVRFVVSGVLFYTDILIKLITY